MSEILRMSYTKHEIGEVIATNEFSDMEINLLSEDFDSVLAKIQDMLEVAGYEFPVGTGLGIIKLED